MQKKNFSPERIASWLADVTEEYGGRYTEQCRAYFDSLKPEDDCQPMKILRTVQEADPFYRRNLQSLLALQKRRFGENCCGSLDED